MVSTSISFTILLVSATFVRNVIKVLCFSPSIGNIQMYILILSNTSLLAERLDVRNITGLPVHATITNSIIKVKF